MYYNAFKIQAVVAFGLHEKLNYEIPKSCVFRLPGGTYKLKLAHISVGAPGFYLKVSQDFWVGG